MAYILAALRFKSLLVAFKPNKELMESPWTGEALGRAFRQQHQLQPGGFEGKEQGPVREALGPRPSGAHQPLC